MVSAFALALVSWTPSPAGQHGEGWWRQRSQWVGDSRAWRPGVWVFHNMGRLAAFCCKGRYRLYLQRLPAVQTKLSLEAHHKQRLSDSLFTKHAKPRWTRISPCTNICLLISLQSWLLVIFSRSMPAEAGATLLNLAEAGTESVN